MIADCTALILAGGESRRMGSDKTALLLAGQSLLQRTLALMRTLFPAVLVSVRQPRADLDDLDAPQVFDERADAGPLAGLCAGLQRAETPWIFAVAADMPYLLPSVVHALAARRGTHQAVVPVIDGRLQPMAAFYATSILPALRSTLHGVGKPGLVAALDGLDICRVEAADLLAVDANLSSFTDLDTPADLAAARQFFERAHSHA
jgi:molybdopterin-guanine dinucleotide biosynthesis protein A